MFASGAFNNDGDLVEQHIIIHPSDDHLYGKPSVCLILHFEKHIFNYISTNVKR